MSLPRPRCWNNYQNQLYRAIHPQYLWPLTLSHKKIIHRTQNHSCVSTVCISQKNNASIKWVQKPHLYLALSIPPTTINCAPTIFSSLFIGGDHYQMLSNDSASKYYWMTPHIWRMGRFNFRHTNQIVRGLVFCNITTQLQKECSFCKKYRERRCNLIFYTFIW